MQDVQRSPTRPSRGSARPRLHVARRGARLASPPAPTPEHQENALIGASALGEDGFHVILVRPRPGSPSNHVVLIVDDDAPTAELAAHVLKKAGYPAAVALGPREAARSVLGH